MTKDTTKEAAVAAEALLLDDWCDAIEAGFGLGRAALSSDAGGGICASGWLRRFGEEGMSCRGGAAVAG